MMLLDLLKYTFVFLLFGFLPVYMSLRLLSQSVKTGFIIALGFSPVLISVLNIVNVFLEQKYILFLYCLLVFVNGTLAYFLFDNLKRKSEVGLLRSVSLKSRSFVSSSVALLLGLIYWYFAFYPYLIDSAVYHDVIFNITIISELKNYFLPIDSTWYSGEARLYHFLSDLYLAGMSNFSGLNVLQVVVFGNFFTCLSIFLLIYLMARNSLIINASVFYVLLLVNFSPEWFPISSLPDHMSGNAASTYFWSVPILFCVVYVWSTYFENIRHEIKSLNKHFISLALLSFVVTFIAFFTKVTIVTVLVALEFYCFCRFVINDLKFNFNRLAERIWVVVSYAFVPVFALVIAYTVSVVNKGFPTGGLSIGLEIADFQAFNSWNLMYPFLAVYGVTGFFLMVNWLQRNRLRFELLFASLINFIIFFITRHIGGSDVFFAFNALLLNALFVVLSDVRLKLAKVTVSLMAMIFLVVCISKFTSIHGFSIPKMPPKFEITRVYGPAVFKNGVVDEGIQDLLDVSQELPVSALIACAGYQNQRHFTYSAFIGRRFWNESSVYAMSTLNAYAPLWEFQSRQGLLPDFFSSTPNPKDETDEYDKFLKEEFLSYKVRYEDPYSRKEIFSKAAFEEQGHMVSEGIANQYGWTHVLVEGKDLKRINSWLKTKSRIDKNDFAIFIL